MKPHTGFTLIELLIVVAIIGILAAVAVPNFLNAQTRAKVARVRVDLRTISQALELYRIDHRAYPHPKQNGVVFHIANHIATVLELTTPTAYMSTVMIEDPFVPMETWGTEEHATFPTYVYVNYRGHWGLRDGIRSFGIDNPEFLPDAIGLTSQGPDDSDSGGVWLPGDVKMNRRCLGCKYDRLYEPSNGLRSSGDILRFGGKLQVQQTMGGG
jgi:type II secretion system protein G